MPEPVGGWPEGMPSGSGIAPVLLFPPHLHACRPLGRDDVIIGRARASGAHILGLIEDLVSESHAARDAPPYIPRNGLTIRCVTAHHPRGNNQQNAGLSSPFR